MLATLATAAILVSAGASAAPGSGFTLLQLTPAAVCVEAAAVVGAGARPVVPELRLYRLRTAVAGRLLPALRSRGALQTAQPDRPAGRLLAVGQTAGDPLSGEEWWRASIGLDGLTPPGPGRPVTVIDSGIDVSHPEFAGRPETYTLNPQEPEGIGGEHGTAVASLVGAPLNGVGFVGIYPQAVLRAWDAATGTGTVLETSRIVEGLIAAANAGSGVINLSLGSQRRDTLIEQAINTAFAKGSLVVAAAGNDGTTGNPLGYPASLPHVLTIASSNRQNAPSSFSSGSRWVDLAAPGEDMTIATALGRGWRRGASGTSFAAPLVSGAAAWVWTLRPELDNTQLFEVMRRSATDIGPPGRDDQSGFGLLNVRSALEYPAPPPDPLEPNDDIDFAKVGGFFANGILPLTYRGKLAGTVQARLDAVEDPRDVYRIWLPPRRTVTATVSGDRDVDLTVWGPDATSVTSGRAADRLGRSARTGTVAERVVVANGARSRIAFVAVTPGRGTTEANYRLTVTTR